MLPALVGPEVADDHWQWRITYNIEYFERYAQPHMKSALMMLSLITGTLYSSWMEKMMPLHDRGSIGELQTANIGWAAYLAPDPGLTRRDPGQ